ncbi:Proton-coupled amino acid transporter-like protein pathetic [Eumeta japonica]|uniref:Proton-coupled amino acid transporter-like protein pathetic n=1 Tax=Eumeta variegata TaxID=151549 RepID=A0A4C1WKA6_EUMVA|nr:Proton-coupled amino acid transporter-like protein pathetic [Eumeta japonica]
MGFAETCEVAFAQGPKRLRPWAGFVNYGSIVGRSPSPALDFIDAIDTDLGPPLSIDGSNNKLRFILVRTSKRQRNIEFVDYSLAATYLGVLCVYVVFIGASCKEVRVFDEFTPQYKLSVATYCAMTLVPLVLICQIRNLKYLVPFSAIANALLVGIFAITMYYMFTNLPPPREREMVADFTQWPLFISTAMFAMEGIGVVMPIENEMAKPQQFLGCPGVLNVAMFVVVILYGIFGFFGYVRFGDDVKGSITLNLPPEDLIAQSAKFLMAVVILFSYSLQFYVPMEMIWRRLRSKVSARYHNLTQVAVRTTIVTGSVAVAAAFPDLENVISLVGAVFFSTLGLLIPVIVETVYKWNKGLGPCNCIILKNIIIGVIGLIALIAGSYSSVKGMVRDLGENNDFINDTDILYGNVF